MLSNSESKPVLSNATYDKLKWVALILLPALGSFYFALAGIWGFPYGEQIVGTIMVVDALLGALLGLSTEQYKQRKEIQDALWRQGRL